MNNPYLTTVLDHDDLFMRLHCDLRGWSIYLRVTRCANGSWGTSEGVNNLEDLTIRSERIVAATQDAVKRLTEHLLRALPKGITVEMTEELKPQVTAKGRNLYVRGHARMRAYLPWDANVPDDPALVAVIRNLTCENLAHLCGSAFPDNHIRFEANAFNGAGPVFGTQEPRKQRAS